MSLKLAAKPVQIKSKPETGALCQHCLNDGFIASAHGAHATLREKIMYASVLFPSAGLIVHMLVHPILTLLGYPCP